MQNYECNIMPHETLPDDRRNITLITTQSQKELKWSIPCKNLTDHEVQSLKIASNARQKLGWHHVQMISTWKKSEPTIAITEYQRNNVFDMCEGNVTLRGVVFGVDLSEEEIDMILAL